MDKDKIEELIKIARDERETGDPNKALVIFNEIDEKQLDSDQLFTYLGEKGLTLWHLKKYDEAKEVFERIKKIAEDLKNDSYMAVALRQLSRPEFNTDTLDKAVEDAKKAREYAFKSNREDIAWFDHGVVSSLIINKSPKEEVESWFLTEAEDIYNISQKTKDQIAKWVWITGLLIDRYKVYNTKADLYTAKIIAEEFKLSRRIEQIDELLKEDK
jgi:tetratricopeptide (TPR) repeat protein